MISREDSVCAKGRATINSIKIKYCINNYSDVIIVLRHVTDRDEGHVLSRYSGRPTCPFWTHLLML